MKQGAECAALTLGTFIESVVTDAQLSLDPKAWLARGAHRANQAVHARHAGQGGSTLVAALLVKGRPSLWLTIGDSRVYRASEGKLTQLSRDDTLEGQLGKPGEGHRPDLLQFVGIGDGLEPHIEALGDAAGTVLLTTDGVHFIDAGYIAKVVQHAPDLGLCARRLTELARMLGGPDNASVAALSLDALVVDGELHLDGSYEVWDPFGELQVVFDRGPGRYDSAPSQRAAGANQPKQLTASPAQPTDSPEKKVASTAPSRGAGIERQGADKGKRQQKKSKPSRRKSKQAPSDEEKSAEGQVPQLLIEFPNKTP